MSKKQKLHLLRATTALWLHFTRAERISLAVAVALLFLLACANYFSERLFLPPRAELSQASVSHLRALLAATHQPNIHTAELFVFDPNTASYEDLLLLGLSARTARFIENYRNKGGKFRRPEDLQRIYTLSEEEYIRLRPFIRIGSRQRDYAGRTEFIPEKKAHEKRRFEYFEFDPNTASASDFARLGLPEWLGARIEKYREKGGVFRKPEDFAKIYGMRPEDFERLAPYLRIAPKGRQTANEPIETPRPVMAAGGESMGKGGDGAPVDINSAPIDEWVRLPGIGAVRAERIIRFREKLGGFAEIEQVAETYSLPDSIYRQIRPMLVRGGAPLRTLNINTADVATLSAHPYVSRKQAELIVAYREQHGPYASTQDIFNILALKREEIARALPYLSVN